MRREHEDGDVVRGAVPRARARGARRARTCTSTRRRRSCGSSRWTTTTAVGRPRTALDFGPLADGAPPEVPARCHDNLRRLERLMLGYDVHPDEVAGIVEDLHGDVLGPARLRPGAHPRRAPPARRSSPTCARYPAPTRRRRPGRGAAAQPAGAPARLPALARRRGRGPARRFLEQLRRRSAPLRDREPRPHARARGGLLSPFLSQQRAEARARRRARILDRRLEQADDAGRARRARTSATRSSAWRRRPRAATRSIADLARETRFRYFDEPLIEAARDEAYARDGGAHRGAGRATRTAPSATSGSRRSSPARGRWPRCSASACAARRPRCGACCSRQ